MYFTSTEDSLFCRTCLCIIKSQKFNMLITSINVFLWSTSGTHVSFREHSINTSELESKVCPKPMHQLQPSPAPRPSPPPAPDSAVHRNSPHRPRTASSLEGKKWTQLLSALTHPTTSATTWTLTTSQPLAQISVSQPFKPRSSKQKSWPLLQAGVLSDHRQGGDLSCPCLTLLPPRRPSHPLTLCPSPTHSFDPHPCDFFLGSKYLSYRSPTNPSSPPQAEA